MTDIDVLLGRSISRQRHHAGISREELARKLHISTEAIAAFEEGRRRASAKQLFDMAQALGVAIEGFFDWNEAQKTTQKKPERPFDGAGIAELEGHYDALSDSHRAAIFAFLLASNKN